VDPRLPNGFVTRAHREDVGDEAVGEVNVTFGTVVVLAASGGAASSAGCCWS